MDAAMADRLVGALCDTLLGSLWLGILLAVAAGVVVLCTRARSSALRYRLLVGVLLSFAAGVLCIGVMKFGFSGSGREGYRAGVSVGTGGDPVLPVMGDASGTVFGGVSAYLNGHSNTIVLVWFMIICARSIQLAVGLYGTYRWKHTGVSAAPGDWRDRLVQLAGDLGVKRCVTLLESGLARVPLVIGHLRPVILVPAGFLTALPADEIEAILLHELAHIRRSDYLVNLLQSFLEIVFFFNPAVWWVSGLIRTERENCCDDLALRERNNMTGYIRALLSCEQYRQRVPAQAVAFAGRKDGLLARVMRVSGEGNQSLSYLEKTLLAVGLVVCGFCWCALLGKKGVGRAPRQVVRVEAPVAVAEPVAEVMQGKVGRGGWKLGTVRKRVGARYAEKGEEYVRTAGYYQGEGYAYPYPARGATEPTRETASTEETEPTRETEPTKETASTKETEPTRETASTEVIEPTGVVAPKSVFVPTGVFAPKRVVAPKSVFVPNRVFAPTIVPARVVEPVKAVWSRYVDPRLPEIIADMLQDGLIVEKDNLDFLLSGTEFIVNGVWQEEAVLAKYKKKYVPGNGGNGWTWSHSQHCPVPGALFQ